MKKLIFLLSLLPCLSSAQEVKTTPVENGVRIDFHSSIMNENRTIWIRVPASYHEEQVNQSYPVMYVLDGKSAFFPVTGVVSFMSEKEHVNHQIPEMIVVGVDTENRFRDLTPNHSTMQPNGEEAKTPEQKLMMEESGGGELFLKFMQEEVIAYVEKNYRTLPYRLYVGHSLGGLTTSYTFLKYPGLFNAAIAIDPSLWWDGARYVKEAPALIEKMPADQMKRYYVSVIDSGAQAGRMKFHFNAILDLGKSMEGFESKKLKYKVDNILNTNHSSIPLLSWYNGLLFIFEGYHKYHFDFLQDPDQIEAHFKGLESTIGLKMHPPADIFEILVHYLTSPNRFPDPVKARKVLDMALKYYPNVAYFQQKFRELDTSQTSITKVRQYRKQHEREIISEYFHLLSIPNHALDKINIDKNAVLIENMLKKRGIKTKLLESKTPNTPKAVYGEVLVPDAELTIVFYAHYDGQPVNPEKWHPAVKPYQPVLLSRSIEQGGKPIGFPAVGQTFDPEWRISCRSSSDDKAGVMAIINAYDALVQSGVKLKHNIKFFFEGEEEIGSLHLGEILEKNKDLLKADLWLIADGPVHQSGLPMIDFGVRGDVNVDLTVYGPKRPLHSGHYGNWAPNPCMMLSRLLASMKDDAGNVVIKGYYDDVIPFTASEKKAFDEIPSVDQQMKMELGINQPEGNGKSLFETYEKPSLNINGIRCADAGDQASNVIATEAKATLDLRQVLGTDYLKQVELLRRHIVGQGYLVLDREPTDEERRNNPRIAQLNVVQGGYNAQRTPLDLPVSQRVIKAVRGATDKKLVLEPTSGGSLPLYLFEQHLHTKVINLCLVNHDNNQHSENENVRLQNLWDAIEQLAAIMVMD
jgi:acetylornithine deacetylase/succinyl-diaminopimelate desuccinylase-like protein/predicted alpha/beta superfamily hydrolase